MNDFNPCASQESSAEAARENKNNSVERLRDAADAAEALAWRVWLTCGLVVPGASLVGRTALELLGTLGGGAGAGGLCGSQIAAWGNSIDKWGRRFDEFRAAADGYRDAARELASCQSEHDIDTGVFPSVEEILEELEDIVAEIEGAGSEVLEEEDEVEILDDEEEDEVEILDDEEEDEVEILDDEEEDVEEDEVEILDDETE